MSTGFVGVNVSDRVPNNPYLGVSETIAYTSTGSRSMRGLLGSVYHLAILMDSNRDVGIGFSSSSNFAALVVDFGFTRATGPQYIPDDALNTYPCQGSTGVARQLFGENPSPIPSRNLRTNPIGTPIMVFARSGHSVTISTASVIDLASGVSVPMRVPIGSFEDKLLRPHTAWVSPESPLEPNKQYQVNLSGLRDGIAYTRSFVMTTGQN